MNLSLHPCVACAFGLWNRIHTAVSCLCRYLSANSEKFVNKSCWELAQLYRRILCWWSNFSAFFSCSILQVAALIGADSREVIFTSGATESNNIAVKGVAHFNRQAGKDHVITVQTVNTFHCIILLLSFYKNVNEVANVSGSFFSTAVLKNWKFGLFLCFSLQ